MSINKVGIVFFSKNGATKQVAETIAEGVNTQPVSYTHLTLPTMELV